MTGEPPKLNIPPPLSPLFSLKVQRVTTGEPFQTSGCPNCNRPFYNEQPGGPMYNYPRPLSSAEAEQAIREMEIEV
jgi:biotin synthase